MKVVILHDRVMDPSNPDEMDVIAQANGVSKALSELGHAPQFLEFSANLEKTRQALFDARPDLVFNLVESLEGQGRLIHFAPALLDSLGIPYTGADAEAMMMTSNKLTTKQLLRAAGGPTADWVTLETFDPAQIKPVPYIIKSRWEHASIGVEETGIVQPGPDLSERLRATLERASGQVRGGCFAEAFIEGREFNIAMLGGSPVAANLRRAGGSGFLDGARDLPVRTLREPMILPPGEIHFVDFPEDKPRIVGYAAKWHEESFEYTHTPRHFEFAASDAPLVDSLCRIAVDCWKLFGLRGYARVDFRADTEGNPIILEVNANPCLAPEAGFAGMSEEAGLTYTQVVESIVRDTVD